MLSCCELKWRNKIGLVSTPPPEAQKHGPFRPRSGIRDGSSLLPPLRRIFLLWRATLITIESETKDFNSASPSPSSSSHIAIVSCNGRQSTTSRVAFEFLFQLVTKILLLILPPRGLFVLLFVILVVLVKEMEKFLLELFVQARVQLENVIDADSFGTTGCRRFFVLVVWVAIPPLLDGVRDEQNGKVR
mmetsp:Transcript_1780/g.3552  ORF Transcript_1780/g.3552 Transcript_1780/m.3552 type:complete len:189 (+) Transcript_1780:521-1087(+)